MSSRRVYVMRKPTLTKLEKAYGRVECCRCGKPILVREKVVSRPRKNRMCVKVYHFKCWLEAFVDL